MSESYTGKINRKLQRKQKIIRAAAGKCKADLVLKNATYASVFSGELRKADIAVAAGLIVGIGDYEGEREIDMTDKIVCPGFLDAHIHLESALVSPTEFIRAVLPHGTTTVIADPHAHHKKIDGHAPGLRGKALNAYVAAGVYSDHECATAEEAIEKLEMGQVIMIREGTAAHNLEALMPLLTDKYADRCMFCTDDKHPSDLLEKGHIDYIIKRAIEMGADPILAVKVASTNAARYFRLNNRGAIAPGYLADFVIIDNFEDFNVEQVLKKGRLMYDNGKLKTFPSPEVDEFLASRAHNTFKVDKLTSEAFKIDRPRGVLGMMPGELMTTDEGYATGVDVDADILKIAVVERHNYTGHIGIGYIKGYGLKSGAVATSISHDSHNIIVVGTNDSDMADAVNHIAENDGGITVYDNGRCIGDVQLAIAGLMSDAPLVDVNRALETAKEKAFGLGINRSIDPFMTLSFMSLPVIPKLRLTTRGVFDVESQSYV